MAIVRDPDVQQAIAIEIGAATEALNKAITRGTENGLRIYLDTIQRSSTLSGNQDFLVASVFAHIGSTG